MKRLLKPLRSSRRDKLRSIVQQCEGGIHQRIDENRQLLEVLLDNVPDFMAANRWVERWLESQDVFLSQIAEAARSPADKRSLANPRPWPGRRRRQANPSARKP